MENSITLNGIKYEYVTNEHWNCNDCDLFVECQSLSNESEPCDIFDFIAISKGYFKKQK